MDKKLFMIAGSMLAPMACADSSDHGPDAETAAELAAALSQRDTGKGDGVAVEYEAHGGRVYLYGNAADDLYQALDASGGFYEYAAGGNDYRFGDYVICVTDGSDSACALRAHGFEGDDTLAFTVHGPRFHSAPSEIFGALAGASGISPASTTEVSSRRFVCAKDGNNVWCGLRALQTFKVRIENVAPFTNAKTGTFAVPKGSDGPGPLAPGDAYEVTFTAGLRHRLVFSTMLGQSNDWFFAPDPSGVPLYDGMNPVSGDVTEMIDLWDAGTEVDEEPAVGPHTGPRQSMSIDGPGAMDPDASVRRVANPAILTDGTSFERPEVADMIRVTLTPSGDREFTLRIENVADDTMTLQTSEGPKPVRVSPGVWALGGGNDPIFTEGEVDRGEGLEDIAESGRIANLSAALVDMSGVATPVSPGVWVLHTQSGPLFTAGQPDRGLGLVNIAETGDIAMLVQSFMDRLPEGATSFGSFNVPAGAEEPGPIHPGDAYELTLSAVAGDHLSFATMYGASNDWLFATSEQGIVLFDGETAVTGDVTGDVGLWDAGSELSEEPGIGPHIGGPVGDPDGDSNVRIVGTGEYATSVDQHIRVTLSR